MSEFIKPGGREIGKAGKQAFSGSEAAHPKIRVIDIADASPVQRNLRAIDSGSASSTPSQTDGSPSQIIDDLPQPGKGKGTTGRVARSSAAAAAALSLAACGANGVFGTGANYYSDNPVSAAQGSDARHALRPGAQKIVDKAIKLAEQGKLKVSELYPGTMELIGQTPEGYLDIQVDENVPGHLKDGATPDKIEIDLQPSGSPDITTTVITNPDESVSEFGPSMWEAWTTTGNLNSTAQVGTATGPTNFEDYQNPGEVKHGPWNIHNAPGIMRTARRDFRQIAAQLESKRPNTRRTQTR